jgi:2-dehydro-3-deoxygalactonokinase
VDWGTSSLRGALLDGAGEVIEERSFARGILSVAPGGFPAVFDECFGDWMKMPAILCLMAGMVGSQQGWREAAYCPCPAGFAEVASQLLWLESGRMAIVPGLSCAQPGLADVEHLQTIPDVMRGEETQVLGALQLLGLRDALMVLPGTHSKWVTVQGGRIQSFATFMTGEFFALLKQHSILARTLPATAGEPDEAAFELGVQIALRGQSLLQTAFSARTLALFERLAPPQRHDYLSGLLIGEELRTQTPSTSLPVVLIGADALTRRYQNALALKHVAAQRIGAQATWAGLRAIANSLALKQERTT